MPDTVLDTGGACANKNDALKIDVRRGEFYHFERLAAIGAASQYLQAFASEPRKTRKNAVNSREVFGGISVSGELSLGHCGAFSRG